jgi:hypothetical protein
MIRPEKPIIPYPVIAFIACTAVLLIAVKCGSTVHDKDPANPNNWADRYGMANSFVSNEKLSQEVSSLIQNTAVNSAEKNVLTFSDVKKVYFECWQYSNRRTRYGIEDGVIVSNEGIRYSFSTVDNNCVYNHSLAKFTLVKNVVGDKSNNSWTVSAPKKTFESAYDNAYPAYLIEKVSNMLDVVNKSRLNGDKPAPVLKRLSPDDIEKTWQITKRPS